MKAKSEEAGLCLVRKREVKWRLFLCRVYEGCMGAGVFFIVAGSLKKMVQSLLLFYQAGAGLFLREKKS